MSRSNEIPIYTEADFACMRRAGRLAAETLDEVGKHVRKGVTTEFLDKVCDDVIRSHGAVPATLGYRGYPKSSCISLNHVICHGIPGKRKLMEGDILNIDTTVILEGWYGDSSRMYVVEPIKPAARRLINVVYESLDHAIASVRPGAHVGDIGAAIQACAREQRCSVVRDFCGHGIGRVFHDVPSVPHFGEAGDGEELKPGMIFTIEPMLNLGKAGSHTLADGWTAITKDRSLSAQAEHTIGITRTGAEIFTESPKGLFHPFELGETSQALGERPPAASEVSCDGRLASVRALRRPAPG